MYVNTGLGKKKIKITSPAAKFFFARIFPLIFVAAGIGLFYKGYTDMELAKESVNWPTVEGKITLSEVDRRTSSSSKGRSSTTYHADIEYNYSVNGIKYTGDKVSYGDYGSSNRGHASGIVRKYPAGKTVEVHYKPERPDLAVIEPGVKGATWMMPLIGAVFGIAGLIMMFTLPKAMNKKEDQVTELEQMQNQRGNI